MSKKGWQRIEDYLRNQQSEMAAGSESPQAPNISAVPHPPPPMNVPPAAVAHKHPELSWQDGCTAGGVMVGLAAFVEVPNWLRVVFLGASGVLLFVSFVSRRGWHWAVRILLSIIVCAAPFSAAYYVAIAKPEHFPTVQEFADAVAQHLQSRDSRGARTAGISGKEREDLPQTAPDLPQMGFQDNSDTVGVTFGANNGAGIRISSLKNMGTVQPVNVDGFSPLVFWWNKGKNRVSYSIKFWSPDNRAPIEITDGQYIVRNSYLDTNHSKNALEIVTTTGQPVLQVIWKSPSHMELRGLFTRSDGMLLCMADNFDIPSPIPPQMASTCSIRPIFKYPSWKHPSDFAD